MSAGDPDSLDETLPQVPLSSPWPLLTRLPSLIAEQQGTREAYRELLKQAHEELKARFFAEEPVESLVHARAALIDTVLRQVWREQLGAQTHWALIAVGGYGRGEL